MAACYVYKFILKILLFTACASCIYLVIFVNFNEATVLQTNSIWRKHSLKFLLKEAEGVYKDERKKIPNTVLIITANAAFKPFVENWLVFARKFGWKFLVGAMDEDAYRIYSEITQYVHHFSNQTSYQATYFSPSYDKLTRSKIAFVHSVVLFGYDVFFTDVDIGYFSDPWHAMIDPLVENCQWIIQRNDCIENRTIESRMGDEANTGFYFIRSTETTIELLAYVAEQKPNDQRVIKNILKDPDQDRIRTLDFADDFDLEKHIMMCYLPFDQFPTGCAENVDKARAIIFHSNWVVGKSQKIQLLYSHGLWHGKKPIISYNRKKKRSHKIRLPKPSSTSTLRPRKESNRSKRVQLALKRLKEKRLQKRKKEPSG